MRSLVLKGGARNVGDLLFTLSLPVLITLSPNRSVVLPMFLYSGFLFIILALVQITRLL